MKENPSLDAMGKYFALEGTTSQRLLDQFLADPDVPFTWKPITASDFLSMRQNVIGTGFAADSDTVDRIAERLIDMIVTVSLLNGISDTEIPEGEIIHPSLDATSQDAFFQWARTDRGDAVMEEAVGTDLFLLASALLEADDGFRKLDLIDKILDLVRTEEGLADVFIEINGEDLRQDLHGLDELDRGQGIDLDTVLEKARTIIGPR